MKITFFINNCDSTINRMFIFIICVSNFSLKNCIGFENSMQNHTCTRDQILKKNTIYICLDNVRYEQKCLFSTKKI